MAPRPNKSGKVRVFHPDMGEDGEYVEKWPIDAREQLKNGTIFVSKDAYLESLKSPEERKQALVDEPEDDETRNPPQLEEEPKAPHSFEEDDAVEWVSSKKGKRFTGVIRGVDGDVLSIQIDGKDKVVRKDASLVTLQ